MSKTIDSTAVAVAREPKPAQELELRSAFDIQPQSFEAGLNRRKKNRKALIAWIQEELVEGVDWGRIHVVKKEQCPDGKYCQNPYHFSKPSLWKAGAEKIIGMMGVRAIITALPADIQEAYARAGVKDTLTLYCELVDSSGTVMSQGLGSRSLAQDYGDVNKAAKMAKKSAMIDAVLNLAGLSEIFTQDVEDMDPDKLAAGAPDPFNPREEPSRQYFPQQHQKPVKTHCPIGKDWRGKPWSEVDDGFLSWIVSNVTDKPDLAQAAADEIRRRHVETDAAKERRATGNMAKTKRLADYARELTKARSIDEILAIKDELPDEFEPSLRSFIATREKELGPK